MLRHGLFKDRRVFDENYIPPELRVRREEAEALARIYLNRLVSGAGLSDVNMIYGSIGRVGIGKTTLAKFTAKRVSEAAGKEGLTVKQAYVNAFNAPNLYTILSLIVRQTGYPIQVRGAPALDILKALVDNLYVENHYLLVILDEFQSMLSSPRIASEDLYTLLRVHEEIPSRDGVNRIGFLLVASDVRALSYMREKIPQVESQIGFKLHLPAYKSRELYTILEQRAELGLRDTVWEPKHLELISDVYGEDKGGDGSARRAIVALKMACEMAEAMGRDGLSDDLVRKAVSENEAASIQTHELEALSIHELIILRLVAGAALEGMEWINAGLLRQRYEDASLSIYNVKPRGYTQYHIYLKHLTSLGLIDAKPSGRGMRGRTTLFRLAPHLPADRLIEVVDSIIQAKLASGFE
ncbi:Cdc6/Cdc18 family protein [Aeropyrum camini]|uniref:Origin recognition complex subunit 2 Orc2 n=1 Tax=Aeropyrum camini SY1 = JCM 12091 TaxID=1198449 RepID=U3T7U0_9CREN|nr:Cdc6/Cdc18 family protein [Aeropyrum camini]BAN89587.1 origin recognition complex subunit 2 Orc2 [Aeropyrum camini SY1 = JCM 12091]